MCARTQFMTDSFLWAERPIMSKTNETMKHRKQGIGNAENRTVCGNEHGWGYPRCAQSNEQLGAVGQLL